MGGDLTLRSEPEKGSEFTFRVPVTTLPPQSVTRLEKSPELVAPLQGKRAALLCQNHTLSGLVRHLCQGWGIEAHSIPNMSPDVVGKLVQWRPDVVIIDPKLQDREHLRQLSGSLEKAGIPWIVLQNIGEEKSAAVMGNGQARARFVFKPVNPLKLISALVNLLVEDGAQRLESVLAKTPTTPTAGLETGLFADRYPARILVVEDVPMNQKIVCMVLKKLGYKVVTIAENGREGVDDVFNGGIDLVFMDLQMPVMGGIEATQLIRDNFDLPRQPAIIALTGHALSGVKESCFAAGMDGYLTKPVSIDDVKNAIIETHHLVRGDSSRPAEKAPIR
ncbi:MAG: response regulator, partial [Verrucomicrobiae bacterium]|nr:response regulator [Verrucomicrobiae bacterium]